MNSYNVSEIWEQLLQRLKNSVSETVYNTIISPAVPLSATDTVFIIGVNNNFLKKWLEENYKPIIENLLAEITGKEFSLQIENLDFTAAPVQKQSPKEEPPAPAPQPVKAEVQAPAQPAKPPEYTGSYVQPVLFEEQFPSNLNVKYTFDTFVIGNSNRFAYAAAQAVAAKPGIAYNPLFIYGGVGLGKTHLMHAIGNQIKKNKPDAKVLYISSEKFLNEIVTSIEKRTMENFKNKYRKIDCLIIDDIQFLEKRERTLEEFFHTFNSLHSAKKQIIISSDKPPKDMEILEERFRSRFEWGLIADITLPDYETRMAILHKKEEMDGYDINEEVIKYIANNIKSNIRELEGAINKVMAFAKLEKKEVTLELAEQALKDIISPDEKKVITPDYIISMVAEHFDVTVDDLCGNKRNSKIVTPRQIAMYLCREIISTPLKSIGKCLGNRDHTTIMHGIDKIEKEINNDENLKNTIETLKKKINPQG